MPLRDHIPVPSEPAVRWRGANVSRLENLSDIVFAFALTLLVVATEVPRSYADLRLAMWDFPAFMATFGVILVVWYSHFLYFRRYGLEDGLTTVLNAVLLLLVLFYVYPLKFLFSFLINGTLLGWGFGIEAGPIPQISRAEMPQLMIVYSAGYLLISLTFIGLYLHALRQRARLALTQLEQHVTSSAIWTHGIAGSISVVSVVLAAVGHAPLAGLVYFLMGPLQGAAGYWNGRKAKALRVPLEPETG
ncbi:MAG: TMEM175 family protein [Bacteroidota bacterium]